jgi:hypothetical protein
MRNQRIPIPWIAAALGAMLSSGCVFAPEFDVQFEATVEGQLTTAEPTHAAEQAGETRTRPSRDGVQGRALERRRIARQPHQAHAAGFRVDRARSHGGLIHRPDTRLLNPFGGVPVESEGETGGILLEELRPGDYWSLMGLREGDLIVAANGHALQSRESAWAAWQDARREGHVSLLVDREGTRHVFNARLPN